MTEEEEMEIRDFEERFHDEVIALVLGIQNDEYDLGLTLAEQPDLEDIQATFAGGGFWIALEEGRVVGCIGLQRKGPNEGALKKFFVDGSLRGKHLGLSLYERLEAFCRNEGVTTIVLDTPSVATRSHLFYEKAGFERISADKLPFPYEFPDRDSMLFLKTFD